MQLATNNFWGLNARECGALMVNHTCKTQPQCLLNGSIDHIPKHHWISGKMARRLSTYNLWVPPSWLKLIATPVSRPLKVACWKPSGRRNGSRRSHHIAGLGVVGWLDRKCQAHRFSFALGNLGHWHPSLVSRAYPLSKKMPNQSKSYKMLRAQHRKDSERAYVPMRIYSFLSAKEANATNKSIVHRP